MTAKQAIKARCRDCLAGARICEFEDCAIKGLMDKQGKTDRTEAIRRYCQWCMNRNPVNQCASPECTIYQYRTVCEGNLNVLFLPLKMPIMDNGGTSKSRSVNSYGKGIEAPSNALITPAITEAEREKARALMASINAVRTVKVDQNKAV
jgi:hypothetical protein